jgi:hypothetical protein
MRRALVTLIFLTIVLGCGIAIPTYAGYFPAAFRKAALMRSCQPGPSA